MRITTTLLALILTAAPAFAQGIEPTLKGLAKELSEQAKVIADLHDRLEKAEKEIAKLNAAVFKPLPVGSYYDPEIRATAMPLYGVMDAGDVTLTPCPTIQYSRKPEIQGGTVVDAR